MNRSILVIVLCLLSLVALPVAGQDHAAKDSELQFAELGHCDLDSGRVIENCKIGYRTFGALNASRSNAILFFTWYNGTSSDPVSYTHLDVYKRQAGGNCTSRTIGR